MFTSRNLFAYLNIQITKLDILNIVFLQVKVCEEVVGGVYVCVSDGGNGWGYICVMRMGYVFVMGGDDVEVYIRVMRMAFMCVMDAVHAGVCLSVCLSVCLYEMGMADVYAMVCTVEADINELLSSPFPCIFIHTSHFTSPHLIFDSLQGTYNADTTVSSFTPPMPEEYIPKEKEVDSDDEDENEEAAPFDPNLLTQLTVAFDIDVTYTLEQIPFL